MKDVVGVECYKLVPCSLLHCCCLSDQKLKTEYAAADGDKRELFDDGYGVDLAGCLHLQLGLC